MTAPKHVDLFEAGIMDLVEEDEEGKVWIKLSKRRYRVTRAPAGAGADAEAEKEKGNPQDYFGASLIDEAEIVAREIQERTGREAEVAVHVRPPMVYLDVRLSGGRVAVEVASVRTGGEGTGAGADVGAKTEGAETGTGAEVKGGSRCLPPPEEKETKGGGEIPPTAVPKGSPLGVKPDRETEEFLTTRIAQSMMVYDWYLKKRRKELERRLKEEEK